jgi:hypothetical protein
MTTALEQLAAGMNILRTGDIHKLPVCTPSPQAPNEIICQIYDLDPLNLGCIFSIRDVVSGDWTPVPGGFDTGVYPRTRLDLVVSDLGNSGDWVKVTMHIEEVASGLFMEGGMAVTGGDEAAKAVMCRAPEPPGASTVTQFYVQIAEGTEAVFPFNLGIYIFQPGDPTFVLPMIYDPKIRNVG